MYPALFWLENTQQSGMPIGPGASGNAQQPAITNNRTIIVIAFTMFDISIT
jgi:hypothetical protein